MRGIKTFVCLTLLGISCRTSTSFGRLGESPQAIQERYGLPLSSRPLSDFTQCMYEKQAFAITVFYRNGISVLETFASRGLDQATARKVVLLVAGAHPMGCPDPTQECHLRQLSGITSKDEVFWTWRDSDQSKNATFNAAFNPVECSLTFFSDPSLCACVHKALESAPLPGY